MAFNPKIDGRERLAQPIPEDTAEATQQKDVTVASGTAKKVLFEQIAELEKSGDFSRGVELLEAAAVQNIHDGEILRRLGSIYLEYVADPNRDTHLRQADTIFMKLGQRETTNIEHQFNRLRAEAYRNDFQNMQQTIEDLKHSGETEGLKQLADIFMSNPSLFLKSVFIYQCMGEPFPRPDLLAVQPDIKKLWDEKGDVYDYLNLEGEMQSERIDVEYRTKPVATAETKKLQAKVDEMHYDIQLDANPYVPIRSNKPDPVKAEVWVKEHTDPVAQAAAKEIFSHTSHISFEVFKQALAESVEDFNRNLGSDETYVVVVRENKSNKWVLELALPSLKKLPDQVIDMDGLSAYLKMHPNTGKVVFLDDASYSGEQLNTFINTYVPSDSKAGVEVIVPYLTHFAEKNVQSASDRVRICSHQTMKTISEEIEDKETLQVIQQMYFSVPRHETKDRGVESHTLTIFDHKVADYLSTLEEVYKEAAVRDHEGNLESRSELREIFPDAVRFVPLTTECYKNL